MINLLYDYFNYQLQWLLLRVFHRLTKRNLYQKQDFYHLILMNCVRDLKLLLQEKRAGKKSDKSNETFVAIADKVLDYKCISTREPKVLLPKGLN